MIKGPFDYNITVGIPSYYCWLYHQNASKSNGYNVGYHQHHIVASIQIGPAKFHHRSTMVSAHRGLRFLGFACGFAARFGGLVGGFAAQGLRLPWRVGVL
jgi:hypothetical protein